MTSWATCIDTDQASEAHPYTQSSKMDIHTSFRNEFAKIFHEKGLDILTDASEIGFAEQTNASTQASSAIKDRSSQYPDYELSYVKSEMKQEQDALYNHRSSPTKSLNFREDDPQPFGFRAGSPYMSPYKGGMQSKENYFYPYHLRSDRSNLKNFADFQENANFPNEYEDEDINLMWDEARPLPQNKNQNPTSSADHQMTKPNKLSFDESDYEDQDNLPIDDAHMRLDPFSKVEDDLGKMFTRRIESSKSMFSAFEHFDSTLDTQPGMEFNPTKAFGKSHTTDFNFALKQDSFFAPDDMEDPYNDLKGRSSRGLRVLSLRVKDVVRMKEKTSYKDVADFLTQEVGQRLKAAGQGEPRDEQNVKRRVYDALNVLIAADILKKDGKVVFCGENVENIGVFRRRELAYDLARLNKRKENAEKKIQKKQRELQEMMFKVLAIKNVMKRNKETHNIVPAGSQPEIIKKTQLKNSKKQETVEKINVEEDKTVKFPFIMVPSQAGSMNLRTNKAKTNMMVESKEPLDIFGDTDVLLKLKLHYVTKDFLSEAISPEMHKYIPSVYLENIK